MVAAPPRELRKPRQGEGPAGSQDPRGSSRAGAAPPAKGSSTPAAETAKGPTAVPALVTPADGPAAMPALVMPTDGPAAVPAPVSLTDAVISAYTGIVYTPQGVTSKGITAPPVPATAARGVSAKPTSAAAMTGAEAAKGAPNADGTWSRQAQTWTQGATGAKKARGNVAPTKSQLLGHAAPPPPPPQSWTVGPAPQDQTAGSGAKGGAPIGGAKDPRIGMEIGAANGPARGVTGSVGATQGGMMHGAGDWGASGAMGPPSTAGTPSPSEALAAELTPRNLSREEWEFVRMQRASRGPRDHGGRGTLTSPRRWGRVFWGLPRLSLNP